VLLDSLVCSENEVEKTLLGLHVRGPLFSGSGLLDVKGDPIGNYEVILPLGI
jgi:hypothetical protein